MLPKYLKQCNVCYYFSELGRGFLDTLYIIKINYHFISFFLKFKSNLLAKRVFFLLNAAFAMTILDVISRVHLPSFVNIFQIYK